MIALLQIEWLKIKRYRTFWVLACLFLVLLPLWNYEVAHGFIKLGGGDKNAFNFLSTAYAFPQVWGNMGFWGSIFIWFLTILVIILTTNEYTYRTNRQNVIDGWNRLDFFHAKVLLVVALSAAATLYLFILGAIFGGINSHSLSNIFTDFAQVGYFFILSVNYLGFGMLIAIWIKRSGLAIGLFLLYSMIIENIVKSILNHYMDKPFGNFMPLQCSDELLPFPMLQMAKAMLPMGTSLSMNTYLMVSVFWCGAYYVISRAILTRRDW